MAKRFAGFPEAMPGFLHELKANNERAWFESHRDEFDRLCLQPCLSFIESVADATAAFDPPHKAQAKTNGSLRRIHRDTRFSRDKTPYHPYLHLIFWCGDHPNRSPGLHLVFSPGGFGMGAGQWALSPEELDRYRQAVCDNDIAGELRRALEVAAAAGCHLEKPALKRVPRGFEADPENEMLIRQKGIVVRNRNEDYPDGFFDERCSDVVLARLRQLLPVQKWLMEHVLSPQNRDKPGSGP